MNLQMNLPFIGGQRTAQTIAGPGIHKLVLGLFLGLLLVVFPYNVFAIAKKTPIPEGLLSGRIQIKGGERSYYYYAPTLSKTRKVPIVFALHGSNGNGLSFAQASHWLQLAKSKQFIVVFPNAQGGQWNDGRDQYVRSSALANDEQFLMQLLKALSFEYHVEPTRVYATGFSNGGMMAQTWGASKPNTVRAIAVAGASLHRSLLKRYATYRTPISVFLMHGTSDPIIPWGGSVKTIGDFSSVKETLLIWLRAGGGVSGKATVRKLPDNKPDGTTSEIYQFLTLKGSRVWLLRVNGGGHALGQQSLPVKTIGKAQQDYNAEALMWDFFELNR
jgi:polyhydroxybutyrate depolymerase